jgi:hypothetical protein
VKKEEISDILSTWHIQNRNKKKKKEDRQATSIQMNAYRLGPRSEENSQWKIKMLRFLDGDASFSRDDSPSRFSSGCLTSTNSLNICSLVYKFLAPLMCPPAYSYG